MENSLASWWKSARPFFHAHAPRIIAQIDDDVARLLKLAAADQGFCICVLGDSAVGKSTLLNAIVAGENTILPAGGIGPLTALATEVRYSAEPYLSVTYRTRKVLAGYRLQIEKRLKQLDRNFVAFVNDESLEEGHPDPATELANPYEPDPDLGAQNDRDKTFNELRAQVTQILTGDQFKYLPLVDIAMGLRALLGSTIGSLAAFSEPDKQRISSAASILALSNPIAATRYSRETSGDAFDSLVRQHISGHLAPLVERIEVGYPSSALDKNITLVDLPGVGIANDRYRTLTSDFVRSKASAVILVVGKSGPTDASVNLIRDSGYWDRLLLSSEDPEKDRCELIIVVTKVDDVAREHYAQQPKGQRTPTATLFTDLRKELRTAIRAQAQQTFVALSTGVSTDEDVLRARVSAQSTLMSRLEVFPVSAIEYRYLLANDDEQRPFIRDSNSSGIPALMTHLDKLSADHLARLTQAKQSVSERLMRNAEATLTQLKASLSASSRAVQEAVVLQEELARFLEPKRRELENRKGAFREFLDVSGTSRVAELVAKAQLSAQVEIAAYLKALRHVHWATLRATVVRGGAFVSVRGLRVDVASDIAQRFQEPLASIWSRTLLKDIRIRTRQYGTVLETAIAEICEWADDRADTEVQREVLRAQERLMNDRVLQLGTVGSEAVEELKDAIMRDLMSTIEDPIRRECEEFRRRGDAVGAGVKNRIHALLEQLAAGAVSAAGSPAIKLLESQFVSVRIDIAKALEDWGDPIQQASDVIIEREQQRLDRSDAFQRNRMLMDIDEVIAELATASEPGRDRVSV